MKFSNIGGLLLVVVVWSCFQTTSNNKAEAEKGSDQQLKSQSGLLIDNGINRGTGYTDGLGIPFNLRYIPLKITNDTTVSVQLHLAFSQEYNYPDSMACEQFRIIPLPEEWALDGVDITETMQNELSKYLETPSINKRLKPGEKLIIAIGTLYPDPALKGGVLPRALFVKSDPPAFPDCDRRMEDASSVPVPDNHQDAGAPIGLGLKLFLSGNCTIISCGQLTYHEN